MHEVILVLLLRVWLLGALGLMHEENILGKPQ